MSKGVTKQNTSNWSSVDKKKKLLSSNANDREFRFSCITSVKRRFCAIVALF